MEPSRILVVDDDEGMREFLMKVLGKEGYTVQAVSSGNEALEVLAQQAFPILITDLRMPEMTGLELLEIVRRRYRQLGVIIITAYASEDSAIKALRLGALDYITKPFQVDEIRWVVAKAFEELSLRWEGRPLKEHGAG